MASSPVSETPPPSEGPLYPLNPGAYDELHRKCRDIFPMCFEGAKVMLQKGLSNNFQVSAIKI